MEKAKKLLDRLMGEDRNELVTEKKRNVCIYLLAGACPYEILKNTRLSIGICKYKNHDVRSTEYDSLDKDMYRRELYKVLHDLFASIKSNIEKITNEKDDYMVKEEILIEQKINEIEMTITNQNFAEMHCAFLEVEQQIRQLENYKEKFYVNDKAKSMPTCDICGMKIIRNFYSNKYISHIQGRAHNGVVKLRNVYTELKSMYY